MISVWVQTQSNSQKPFALPVVLKAKLFLEVVNWVKRSKKCVVLILQLLHSRSMTSSILFFQNFGKPFPFLSNQGEIIISFSSCLFLSILF